MNRSEKPTTIKLSGDLLKKIEKMKPIATPLTTFVREAIERDLQRKQIAQSAEAYADFISQHPSEARWLKDWEASRLDLQIKANRKKRK